MRRMVVAIACVVLLAVGVGAAGAGAAARINAAGNARYAAGDYAAALAAYARARRQHPEAPELDYNAGNALYRLQRFAEAAAAYEAAATNARPELAQRAWFNLGNAALASGMPDRAIEAYREALRIDPDDVGAKRNLELAARTRRPPPRAPSGGSGGDRDERGEDAADGPEGDSPDPGAAPARSGATRRDGTEPGAGTPGAEPETERLSRAEALRLLAALQADERGALRSAVPLPETPSAARAEDW